MLIQLILIHNKDVLKESASKLSEMSICNFGLVTKKLFSYNWWRCEGIKDNVNFDAIIFFFYFCVRDIMEYFLLWNSRFSCPCAINSFIKVSHVVFLFKVLCQSSPKNVQKSQRDSLKPVYNTSSPKLSE